MVFGAVSGALTVIWKPGLIWMLLTALTVMETLVCGVCDMATEHAPATIPALSEYLSLGAYSYMETRPWFSFTIPGRR